MNMHKLGGLALTGALVFAAGAASAHGKLLSATPAAGSEGASPAEIRLAFSEAFFPNFTGIVLKDAAGHAVKTGAAHAENGKTVLVTPVSGRLAPGAYQVEWHAVCMDTHRMKGEYRFTVK
jgi:methionine-rich copper-binding protein CopC